MPAAHNRPVRQDHSGGRCKINRGLARQLGHTSFLRGQRIRTTLKALIDFKHDPALGAYQRLHRQANYMQTEVRERRREERGVGVGD